MVEPPAEPPVDPGPTDYSGYIVVGSVNSSGTYGPTNGLGMVTLYNPQGQFVAVLRDFVLTNEYPTGIAYDEVNRNVYVTVEGTDRIEVINLDTRVVSTFGPVTGLSAAHLRGLIRRPSDGSLFIAEWDQNNVEMYSSNGARIGSPYISSITDASCNLSGPYGMAYIPSLDRIAVVSQPNGTAAGRLSLLNISNNPATCITHVTGSPFNNNYPNSIAYHSQTNKLLITFAGTGRVHSCDLDGSNCLTIVNSAAIVTTPRAIAVDSDGFIYVGSAGTETIEKFSWNGSGLATRIGTEPFIGPSIFTYNPTSILVIP